MNYQYNYPYVAPQNLIKPKYRAPVFTKIFAILSAVICMIFILFSTTYGVNSLTDLLVTFVLLASSVLLIVSTFTGKGILSAIASFLLALYFILYSCSNIIFYLANVDIVSIPFLSYIFPVLEAILLILIGLHFILKGKGLNSTAKMIFAICYVSLELLSSILSFVNLVNLMMYASGYFLVINFFTVFLDLLFAVFVTLILIFFNPYKKPKQPKMPYYNNYNNFNRFNGPYNNGQYNNGPYNNGQYNGQV